MGMMLRRSGLLWAGMVLAGLAQAALPPRFPAGSVWHQDISAAPLHADSQSMLQTLSNLGGWGSGNHFQIDFSFNVRTVVDGESVTLYPVVVNKANSDYYSPDCEDPGTLIPVPMDAAIEGQQDPDFDVDGDDLTCSNGTDDCHLLVESAGLLYEVYQASFDGSEVDATCLAVWDLNVVYPGEGRGDHCTSADAAGFPIAPLMPSPDEVAAAVAVTDGDLGHAIRFILPNPRMATDSSLGGDSGKLYVRPASHAGGPTGPAGTVPYGVRMRLRADFPLAGYNAAEQVILRTMQRYGIVLSDGGNIALTFSSDRHNSTTWDALGITSQSFFNAEAGAAPVQVTDFQIIDTGPRIGETYDCVRSAVVPGGRIFRDGFEDGGG